VVTQLFIVVAFLVGSLLFRKFIGGATDFLLVLIGLPVLGFSVLIVLVYSLWRPTWSKMKYAGLCLLLVVGLFASYPQIIMIGNRIFFMSRHNALDAFTKDILRYGKIRSMSDGLRHFKGLNGELIAYTTEEIDSQEKAGMRQRRPLGEILSRDEIDPKKYEEFRTRLQRLKLIEFEVQPGYVAFLYDGILDNCDGYLVTRNGAGPPSLHTDLFGDDLINLKALGNDWYWFGTT
jgi:hypothetical protein